MDPKGGLLQSITYATNHAAHTKPDKAEERKKHEILDSMEELKGKSDRKGTLHLPCSIMTLEDP